VVVSSAEDGDEVANTILREAVQELADSVVAVVRRLALCGEGNYDVDCVALAPSAIFQLVLCWLFLK
jgi:hypothetical protein